LDVRRIGKSGMTGYTKLFQSLVTSSVWQEADETRIIWITMLALSNRVGMVEASVVGLAHVAKVGLEKTEEALVRLSSPDPHSRCSDNEGRRIEKVEGGWMILNRAKYRERLGERDRGEYQRMKQAEYRRRNKAKKGVGSMGERVYVAAQKDGDEETVKRLEEMQGGGGVSAGILDNMEFKVVKVGVPSLEVIEGGDSGQVDEDEGVEEEELE
jgi:hypothetical protein